MPVISASVIAPTQPSDSDNKALVQDAPLPPHTVFSTPELPPSNSNTPSTRATTTADDSQSRVLPQTSVQRRGVHIRRDTTTSETRGTPRDTSRTSPSDQPTNEPITATAVRTMRESVPVGSRVAVDSHSQATALTVPTVRSNVTLSAGQSPKSVPRTTYGQFEVLLHADTGDNGSDEDSLSSHGGKSRKRRLRKKRSKKMSSASADGINIWSASDSPAERRHSRSSYLLPSSDLPSVTEVPGAGARSPPSTVICIEN